MQIFRPWDGVYADKEPDGICVVDGRSCRGGLSCMITISHGLYPIKHLEGILSIT